MKNLKWTNDGSKNLKLWLNDKPIIYTRLISLNLNTIVFYDNDIFHIYKNLVINNTKNKKDFRSVIGMKAHIEKFIKQLAFI